MSASFEMVVDSQDRDAEPSPEASACLAQAVAAGDQSGRFCPLCDPCSPLPTSTRRETRSGAVGASRRPPRKITYAPDARPFLSARIQDLYGVTDDLRIAAGGVSLVIHVLAPNHRPVQVTNSLKTFWAEAYPKRKQQLQRQYSKHEWR